MGMDFFKNHLIDSYQIVINEGDRYLDKVALCILFCCSAIGQFYGITNSLSFLDIEKPLIMARRDWNFLF